MRVFRKQDLIRIEKLTHFQFSKIMLKVLTEI